MNFLPFKRVIKHNLSPFTKSPYVFYFPTLDLFFLSIPKNACTTLKFSLLAAEFKESNLALKNFINSISNPFEFESLLKPFQVSISDLKYKSSKILYIHQDTFSKFASCYLDKVCRVFPVQEAFVVDTFKKSKGLHIPPYESVDISFIEFLSKLSGLPLHAKNSHFRLTHELHPFLDNDDLKNRLVKISICDLRLTKELFINNAQIQLLNHKTHSVTSAQSTLNYESDTYDQLLSANASQIWKEFNSTSLWPDKKLLAESAKNYMSINLPHLFEYYS